MGDLNDLELALVAVLQQGLPLVSHPYARIGAQVGMSERQVIEFLKKWQGDGTVRRMGVVVRHHELGYRANAMVVWDVPDEKVQQVGQCLGKQSVVTLCYRRPRRLPQWPYNLFCMIHGRDRAVVLQHLEQLVGNCGLEQYAYEVLFSSQRFKQQGACSIAADGNNRLLAVRAH